MKRRERPLMPEELHAIEQLNAAGWTAARISTALFCSKRQVQHALKHKQGNDGTRVAGD